ncbi:MAG TPA: hypothetical protein VND93_32715 [Myxococcales bacterium]|jgi:hypothetical protein|nr:hypothetical protein [Myxococcales bacterium]
MSDPTVGRSPGAGARAVARPEQVARTSKSGAPAHDTGRAVLAQAAQLERRIKTNRPVLRESVTQLGKLEYLQTLSAKDPGLLSDDRKVLLMERVGQQRSIIHAINGRIEKDAGALVKSLSDPAVRAQLAKLQPGEFDNLIKKISTSLAGTKAGRQFAANEIAHGIQDPQSDPLWKRVFSGSKESQGTALELVKNFAPDLALKGEKVLHTALQRALGLKNAAQVTHVEDALEVLADTKGVGARAEHATKALEALGIKGGLNQVAGAFAAVSFVLGLNDLRSNPSARNALSSAKDTADLIAMAGKLSPKLAKFSKLTGFAGSAAPAIGAAVGYMDAWDSAKKGDMRGTFFDSLSVAGGVMGTAGLGLTATVAGSVVGAPLALAGAVVGGVGALGKLFFGESDAARIARQLLG